VKAAASKFKQLMADSRWLIADSRSRERGFRKPVRIRRGPATVRGKKLAQSPLGNREGEPMPEARRRARSHHHMIPSWGGKVERTVKSDADSRSRPSRSEGVSVLAW
jgi:hypothetical protein